MKQSKFLQRFRIDKPGRFRLADMDPGDTAGLKKGDARSALAQYTDRIPLLQEKLYAADRWAVLVILQGIDAAGKDGAIEHVMSGLNPQGCFVHSFKVPNPEELDHDFLWRSTMRLPARGDIGIFNRSYYEEVLVVRVHQDLLEQEKLPPGLITKRIWAERFEDINAFERHLTRNGTVIVKLHLHISKDEQKRRLLARLDEPAKRWKFSMQDVAERKLWDRYMDAYENMIRNTSTAHAPWYVVPADHKWFARMVVARAVADALDRLGLEFPKADKVSLREMRRIRKALEAQ